ncbi:MAG TPA: SHOCT domain-containing protein [Candidatus Krumholzibacteria bacterium]|nr:SHOCT domain-containing protein [Candidatus Krumholzibacteria bacterium]
MSGALGGMAGNPIMSLFWFALLGVGIYFFAKLASGRSNDGHRPATSPDPEELLKQRYARGEITREDYAATLKELRR